MQKPAPKSIVITVSVIVVIACLLVSIAKYSDHREHVRAAQANQVQQLQTEVKRHDAINKKAVDNANVQIVNLNNQKTVLCAQITAKKLPQPLCQ